MDHTYEVGDVVTLKVACLGNTPGTRGVVYELYDLGDGPAASIIFENGNYDGFGPDELNDYVEFVEHCQAVEGYLSKNVITLSIDFNNGIFDPALKK
jgi:hypothetical protein